ncbi:MAG: hypothetical protein ACI9OJ_004793 [Myxococcota bacterium]|jgi:hypothetical protein
MRQSRARTPHPDPRGPPWAPRVRPRLATPGPRCWPLIYEVFPLRCPKCGGEMKILAFLTDPFTVRHILRHLGISPRPPPVAPALGPPQRDLGFDQSPEYDPEGPEPVPAFEFDPSVSDEFDRPTGWLWSGARPLPIPPCSGPVLRMRSRSTLHSPSRTPKTLPVPLSSIPVASSMATSLYAFSSHRQALWNSYPSRVVLQVGNSPNPLPWCFVTGRAVDTMMRAACQNKKPTWLS